MAVENTLFGKIDSLLSDIFAGWSLSTTVIATLLFLFLAYPWLTSKDPDTHPFLLARQASASPVRHPGESAVHRAIEIPYGYPLRSGLNVKDPGAPKWSSGRNGDLTDIWIQAARGPLKDDGSAAGPKAKLLTVLGKKKVVERSMESVTIEINAIGRYIQGTNAKRVAICLSNSVELLASIFACSFYGIHPVLIAHGSSAEVLIQHIRKIQPEVLIAEAGTMEFQPVLSACDNLSHVIWLTRPGNEHMDFALDAESVEGKVKSSTWHDLVDKHRLPADSEIPTVEKGSHSTGLSIVESTGDVTTVVEYGSKNIVAAVAGLMYALSRSQMIGSDDVVLPIAPLTSPFTLVLTFAALFSHATVALNSVAGESVDFAMATSSIQPTIIVAASRSTSQYHERLMRTQTSPLSKLSRYWQTKSLLKGSMPKMPSFGPPGQHESLSKLRLLLIYHRADDEASPRLSTGALADLKILLGARTCYALTASGVAGAICQTNMFDYRQSPARYSHFGPPLSCVEVLLTGSDDDENLGSAEPQGKIVVRGPAVSGGKVELDLVGRIGSDNTLSLL